MRTLIAVLAGAALVTGCAVVISKALSQAEVTALYAQGRSD